MPHRRLPTLLSGGALFFAAVCAPGPALSPAPGAAAQEVRDISGWITRCARSHQYCENEHHRGTNECSNYNAEGCAYLYARQLGEGQHPENSRTKPAAPAPLPGRPSKAEAPQNEPPKIADTSPLTAPVATAEPTEAELCKELGCLSSVRSPRAPPRKDESRAGDGKSHQGEISDNDQAGPPGFWPRLASAAGWLVAAAIAVLILVLVPAGWILWRRIVDPLSDSIVDLQKRMRRIEDAQRQEGKLDATEIKEQIKNFIRSELRSIILTEIDIAITQRLSETRTDYQTYEATTALAETLGYDEGATPGRRDWEQYREAGRSAARIRQDPVGALLSEYDDAIRGDKSTVDAFVNRRVVFSLSKIDERSPDGFPMLQEAAGDAQEAPFWGIQGDNSVIAILPGRYLFMHASTAIADSGRAGDRTFGEIFRLVEGAGFNLRKVARARQTAGGYEVFEEGQLELPRSRG